jgi:hypothetical protein
MTFIKQGFICLPQWTDKHNKTFISLAKSTFVLLRPPLNFGANRKKIDATLTLNRCA